MLGLNPRCEVSRVCVELSKAYKGDELLDRLAMHTADEWLHLYRPKIFGSRLPEVMVKYQKLKTEKERDAYNKDNPEWIKGKEMTDYAETKRRYKIENQSNRHFLEETLQRLKDSKDTVRAGKVRGVLAAYTHVKV